MLTAGERKVIQAITLRYFNGERNRATPEVGYHAARSAFAVADAAGIASVATYLWAIRDGYGTLDPPRWPGCAPAEEVAARRPRAVIVEPSDERTCFANVGSDSPSTLAVWLGLLEADFDVDDCPELTDELRKLADRHTRAVR